HHFFSDLVLPPESRAQVFRKPSCAAICSAGHEFIGARTAKLDRLNRIHRITGSNSENFVHSVLYFSSYARFSATTSIFSISIIAVMTRSAFALSGSLSMSPRTTGLTCHDNPNLSLSQPHGPVDPPSAESFSQK